MRALTMDERALVSGGDGICVNVDGSQIALGLGGGVIMGSAVTVTTCKDGKDGGS